ncbi:dynein regulatory complex subunit 3-like [Schistocerca gregaria]|uniref:dynein regulatory complex subunit 3-like n=1 Tax=Schistocerca gregaria TaxID=7010 RepID=UPI00211DDE06|nr:dynein regulatory complex subunit 3-like [Schistocerca gregaria]
MSDDLEPGVIDAELLRHLVLKQRPKGEAGRISGSVILEEVLVIRLDDLNILRIDNLWMMTSLVKLHLALNKIQKIENLDALVNLKELDLSFNYIEVIENLDNLTKLEIFTIYNNSISKVENMDSLVNLRLFSIGKNKLADWDNVIYLRRFSLLRTLNMDGNPCADIDGFAEFVYACLPKLVYYHYRYIHPRDKELAREKYSDTIAALEKTETEAQVHIEQQKEEEQKSELYSAAFVEQLDSDQLFNSLYEGDEEGKALLKIGDEAMELYNNHDEFCGLTQKLFELGLERHKIRLEEMQQFTKCVDEAKENNAQETEELMGNFFEKKALIFLDLKRVMKGMESSDIDVQSHYDQLDITAVEFHNLCETTETELMAAELILNNQLEKTNAAFERNLIELVSTFIKDAQAIFVECRNSQQIFNEQLSDCANRYLSNVITKVDDPKLRIPHELQQIMTDKEALNKATGGSHDYHTQIINGREDVLVKKAKKWASDMCADIHRERFIITQGKTLSGDILARGEPGYNTDVGITRNVLKPKRKLSEIDPEQVAVGTPMKQTKRDDIMKLLRLNYGEDWQTLLALLFYKNIIFAHCEKDNEGASGDKNEGGPI